MHTHDRWYSSGWNMILVLENLLSFLVIFGGCSWGYQWVYISLDNLLIDNPNNMDCPNKYSSTNIQPIYSSTNGYSPNKYGCTTYLVELYPHVSHHQLTIIGGYVPTIPILLASMPRQVGWFPVFIQTVAKSSLFHYVHKLQPLYLVPSVSHSGIFWMCFFWEVPWIMMINMREPSTWNLRLTRFRCEPCDDWWMVCQGVINDSQTCWFRWMYCLPQDSSLQKLHFVINKPVIKAGNGILETHRC